MHRKYKNLKEFYPFYAQEHQNPTCRLLHVLGTSLSLLLLGGLLIQSLYQWLWLPLVTGYFFAWIGHFVFEKNKPATFQHPFYSFISDFVLLFRVLTGKEKIFASQQEMNQN